MKFAWDKLTEAEKFKTAYKRLIKRPGSRDLLAYLERKGFFFAPASTKYHGNYSGGLAEHSNNVFRRLVMLEAEEERKNGGKNLYSPETLAVVGLLHDICKTDSYIREENDEKVSFIHNPGEIPFGHGEKSVYMILQYMRLTEEEALAIRWHMGAFDKAARSDPSDLDKAMNKSKLVLLLHTADNLAAHFDEKEFVTQQLKPADKRTEKNLLSPAT